MVEDWEAHMWKMIHEASEWYFLGVSDPEKLLVMG